MDRDYYATLGISCSASKADIKEAYRKMAKKYHPDKQTGDEDKFKEISEAYKTLSNTENRKMYDQHGPEYAKHGAGGFGGVGGGAQYFRDNLGEAFGVDDSDGGHDSFLGVGGGTQDYGEYLGKIFGVDDSDGGH